MSYRAELLTYAVKRMSYCTGLAYLLAETEARLIASELIGSTR